MSDTQVQQVYVPTAIHLHQKKNGKIDPRELIQIKYKGMSNIAKIPTKYYVLKKTSDQKAEIVTKPNNNCVIQSKIESKVPPQKRPKVLKPLKVAKRSRIRISSN